MILGFLTILIALKGLGGSFNALFNALGLSLYHGPVVGATIAGLLIAYFAKFKRESTQVSLSSRALIIFFVVLLALGTIVRIQRIESHPIDEGRADMLVTITSQIKDFLSGNDPYVPYTTDSGRTLQRFYLPILWLSYTPFYVARVDIRYLNILAQLFSLVLILLLFLKRGNYPPWSPKASSGIFLILIALFLFSKQKIMDVLDVQTAPFWIFYSLVLFAEATGRKKLTNIAIPLVLVCRHPAILLFLPFFLHLLLRDRKRLLQIFTLCIATLGLLIFPFMKNPFNIIESILFYAGGLKETPLDITSRFYGISSVLQRTHTEWLQKPLQISGLLWASWQVFKNPSFDSLKCLALGGVAYTTFIVLVSSTPAYVWAELILLVYFLLHAPPEPLIEAKR